jgi:hypothetical protein
MFENMASNRKRFENREPSRRTFENMESNRRKFEYREPSRRIFENRALKGRRFGNRKQETARGWRELRNETQHNLYSAIRASKNDDIEGT